MLFFFFFFNDTATTEIYTLSLHDALPISQGPAEIRHGEVVDEYATAAAVARARDPLHLLHDHAVPRQSLGQLVRRDEPGDRKSTRLNSSHGYISYAVFCLKKKKTLLVDQH